MNNKIYPIAFLLMLAMNIALVSFIVFTPDRPPKREARGRMQEQIADELGFTDNQLDQYNQMVRSHREAMREIEERERELVELYFKDIGHNKKDAPSDSLIARINQLKGQKIETTYQHLLELKGLCSEDQLEKFDELLQRIIPRLTGAQGRSGNGPPRPERR